ncbi:glycosyltransferase [Nocardioides sp. CCNWLW216]|uniref:glycosyltransferase n=1 Tax=Nocardioides sp. CCNWLW216 TaxID=3125803 RepID=UPI003FA53441
MIPTTGRPSLTRAIESARSQTGVGRIEIIVVVDKDPSHVLPDGQDDLADQVLWTGGQGGAFARNLGTAVARGKYVAYLDDDDAWMPDKLNQQVLRAKVVEKAGLRPVLASRHMQIDPSGRESGPIPNRAYRRGDVATYLFRKRRPGGGRPSIYTSTLLVERSLALEAPWDESLRRHQDWDWIIRVTALPNVILSQLETPLVKISLGSAGSISAAPDWRPSLLWARTVLRPVDERVYCDFLAAQTLRYAIQGRDREGVAEVFKELRMARRLPSLSTLAIGLAGVLSRGTMESLMGRLR